MKRYLAVFILLLACRLSATTVTGTIQDINGNRYSNGTVSAFNVISGASMTPSTTDANGSFSITLSPSTYQFTVCAKPVNIGPNGGTSVTQVCAQPPAPIIISGGSQDVSTQINAVAPILGPSVAALLGANNAFLGNNTHAGTEAFNGAVSLTAILTGSGSAAFAGTFGGNPTVTGNWIHSGTVTFTGIEQVGNINQDLYVSSPTVAGTYTTCQAAVTAAGANNRIIHIPPDYNGSDCPLTVGKNILLWNEDSTRLYVNDGLNFFQVTGGGTDSTIHWMGARSTISTGGAFVTGYFTSTFNNGVVGTGVGIDGMAGEANTTGTLTGTLPIVSSGEFSNTIGSTGGRVAASYGIQGYTNILSGNTTTIGQIIGIYGLGKNVSLGATPDNAFGVFAEQQVGATQYNYALSGKGLSILLYSPSLGIAGLDIEDDTGSFTATTGGADHHHRFLYLDSSNNTNIQSAMSTGLFFRDSGGVARMNLTSSGIRVGDTAAASFGFDVGTNAGFQGSRNFFLENAGGAGLAGWEVIFADSVTHTLTINSNNNGAMSPSGSWNCFNVTPVTVNTSTTGDQNIMACTIPAGTLNRVGRSLRIATSGVYSTPAASTAQMTVKAKLCTVSGCGSGTVITLVNIQSTALGTVQITNDNWSLNTISTTQAAGATSSHEAHGDFLIDLATLTTAADSPFGDTNTATIGTIDSTAQLFLQMTFAFSAASGSNTATERQLIAETIN